MRIVLAGTPAVAVPSLEALAASGHELVGVVTRPDRPSGRGRRVGASAVGEAAAALGLQALKPDRPGNAAFLDQLRAWRPDVVATVAYGALLPESALTIPPHGWINLHFSLLPAWRGAAPVQRAIWAGDPITGATTFQIVKELDAGPVYGVVTYEVPPRATSGQVLEALSFDGAKLLVATMDLVASGEARPEPQSLEGLSHAPKVTVEEARVDWNRPANAVDRQIRACTPSPGAWTTFRGKRLKVGPLAPPAASSPEHLLNDQRSGAVIGLKDRVLVRTATELVALGEVEPAGKGWMDAAAWARGVRVDSGDWNGRGWEGKERFGE